MPYLIKKITNYSLKINLFIKYNTAIISIFPNIIKSINDIFVKFFKSKKLKLTHWSYFENWDPYRNYMYAKKNAKLGEAKTGNIGTFTNFAQNDQELYSLHAYFMYIKFGFGRL